MIYVYMVAAAVLVSFGALAEGINGVFYVLGFVLAWLVLVWAFMAMAGLLRWHRTHVKRR